MGKMSTPLANPPLSLSPPPPSLSPPLCPSSFQTSPTEVTNPFAFSGLPSPGGSAAKELASLGAAADSLGATTSGPAPTWSKVLGNLKLWGIAPASQSAAATPASNKDQGLRAVPHGPGSSSQSRRQLNLSDSDTEFVEAESRALSESEAVEAPGGSRRGRAMPLGAQQQDRLFSSLDSSQVSLYSFSLTPPPPPHPPPPHPSS